MRDNWTFLSNHGHVLVCLAADPDVLLRDVASCIGITERAVQQIVADLEGAAVITRQRRGRRNRYCVQRDAQLRHAAEGGVTVGELLDPLLAPRLLPDCPFLSRCTLAKVNRLRREQRKGRSDSAARSADAVAAVPARTF